MLTYKILGLVLGASLLATPALASCNVDDVSGGILEISKVLDPPTVFRIPTNQWVDLRETNDNAAIAELFQALQVHGKRFHLALASSAHEPMTLKVFVNGGVDQMTWSPRLEKWEGRVATPDDRVYYAEDLVENWANRRNVTPSYMGHSMVDFFQENPRWLDSLPTSESYLSGGDARSFSLKEGASGPIYIFIPS